MITVGQNICGSAGSSTRSANPLPVAQGLGLVRSATFRGGGASPGAMALSVHALPDRAVSLTVLIARKDRAEFRPCRPPLRKGSPGRENAWLRPALGAGGSYPAKTRAECAVRSSYWPTSTSRETHIAARTAKDSRTRGNQDEKHVHCKCLISHISRAWRCQNGSMTTPTSQSRPAAGWHTQQRPTEWRMA